MSLRRNIAINFLGQAVVALAPLLAVPWYLRGLGPQQWGLAGFVTTFVAVLGMVETGIGQALVREFAVRLASADGAGRASALLQGYERLYWGFGLLAAIAGALLAQPISQYWLQLGTLPPNLGQLAVYGAALLFAVQFPGFLYRSALMGSNAYGALNLVQAGSVTLRHLSGALLVLHYHQLWVLLACQIVSALGDTLIRRHLCRGLRGTPGRLVGAWRSEVMLTLPTVSILSGAVLLSVLTIQSDKILLSRQVPIEAFGYYAIASTLALGILQLIAPVTQAALPRVAVLQDQPRALQALNRRLGAVLIGITMLAAAAYLLVGHRIVALWLRSDDAARMVEGPLDWLLLGSAANALYNLGYLNWLGSGRTRPIVIVNLCGLVLALVFLPLLVSRFGITGASVSWIGMNAVGLAASLAWLLRNQRV